MSLKLSTPKNGKGPNDEIIRIKVLQSTNLKGYAIIDETFNQAGNASNEFRHIYVFPDYEVSKGDWVRLYSGTGNQYSAHNNGETLTHHFYWGSKGCVWNNNGKDKARLINYTVEGIVSVPEVK